MFGFGNWTLVFFLFPPFCFFVFFLENPNPVLGGSLIWVSTSGSGSLILRRTSGFFLIMKALAFANVTKNLLNMHTL